MRNLMEPKKSSDQTPVIGVVPGPASGDSFLRRNNRGCKSKEFYNWPEQPFEEMDSPLAVQQYIQQLVHRNPADIDEILRLPEGQDLGAWKIEHLRLFCMQLNRLAAQLQDCCFPDTCNQMTATEQWIFLCAAHKQPNECPAIDYTRHTLDGAASLLNSNKYFPSRVTIKESSVAKLGSIFEDFESETHLCKRFSKFVTMYELMPKESLIVPSDGSKPDIDIEKASISSSDTTMLDASVSDATNQQAAGSTKDVSPAAPVDSQTGAKVDNNNETEPKVKVEPVETKTSPPAKSTAATVTPKTEPKDEVSPGTTAAKKANANSTTPSPPKSTTWTPSPMSTNTMVKSSPSLRAAAAVSADVKKVTPDSENKPSAKAAAPPAANQ